MILPLPSLAGDKVKPEEIVAKHLESIGTAEARAKVTNRIVGGAVVATFAEPQVKKKKKKKDQFKGQVVWLPKATNILLACSSKSELPAGRH